jgi:hypothetical protein
VRLIVADTELHEILSCTWRHVERHHGQTGEITALELAPDEHAMLHAILYDLHPAIVWRLRGFRSCSLCRRAVQAHVKECWKCHTMQKAFVQFVMESAHRREATDLNTRGEMRQENVSSAKRKQTTHVTASCDREVVAMMQGLNTNTQKEN